MKPMGIVLLILFSSFGLWSQAVDTNSITVYVTRSMDVRAEQVSFELSVSADLDSDLTSVTTALTAAGIQSVTFAGVSDVYKYQFGKPQVYALNWRFTYSVPYAQFKGALARLGAAAKTIAGSGDLPSLTYSLSGTSVSDATIADARRKLNAPLIADARKEAALLAEAAGMAVGQILGITGGNSIGGGGTAFTSRPGGCSYGGTASPTCTIASELTVKFATGR